jgi:hypothetical protein
MEASLLIKWGLILGIPLLCLLLYRLILRVFFGLVIVPEDRIGLVTKKFVLVGKQVLEPTIGNYFRNSAQDSDVIAFLGTRKERQDSEKIEWLAKAEGERISLTGNAEAEKTLAIGKSSAESYKLAVEAMGGANFTQLKVMEAIGAQHIKIMPDILIGGGGDGAGGPISGLMGLQLLEQLNKK